MRYFILLAVLVEMKLNEPGRQKLEWMQGEGVRMVLSMLKHQSVLRRRSRYMFFLKKIPELLLDLNLYGNRCFPSTSKMIIGQSDSFHIIINGSGMCQDGITLLFF